MNEQLPYEKTAEADAESRVQELQNRFGGDHSNITWSILCGILAETFHDGLEVGLGLSNQMDQCAVDSALDDYVLGHEDGYKKALSDNNLGG